MLGCFEGVELLPNPATVDHLLETFLAGVSSLGELTPTSGEKGISRVLLVLLEFTDEPVVLGVL